MRITKVELKSFKRSTDLTVDVIPADARLVLLVGSNGSGKSSVFDAFSYADSLWKNDAAPFAFNRQKHFKDYSAPFSQQSLITEVTQLG